MHICLLAVIGVQIIAFSKGVFFEESIFPSIDAGNTAEQAELIKSGLYYTTNAILDYAAFLMVMGLATTTSAWLSACFVTSIGLHFVGFIGFSSDVYYIYPYLAYALLLAELLIVASGYNGARLDINSRRDFIGIYDRGNRADRNAQRKA